MLGIELTTGQKVQVGFITIVLGIAAFFLIKSARPAIDASINTYIETKHSGANPGRISTTNPVDPKKDQTITVFASTDGRMEIVEFKKDPDAHPRIQWFPELRISGKTYQYYRDPMAPVAKTSDPFRHALADETYSTVFARSFNLLRSAQMTPDQARAESDARKLLTSEVTLINTSLDLGTFQSKMMDDVMKALAAYNAKSGDPLKDADKADLAKKVMEASAAFQDRVLKDKYEAIEKYMNTVSALLDPAQKEKLVAAEIARKTPRPANAAPRRAPATTRAASRPAATGSGPRPPATRTAASRPARPPTSLPASMPAITPEPATTTAPATAPTGG